MTVNIYAGCNYTIPANQCTADTCCVAQALPFNYLPSYAGNLALAIYFAIAVLPQLVLGICYGTWGYMTSMIIGLALEVLGYAARILIRDDPFNSNGFVIYLIANTIAPVFLAAAIYLCLTRTLIVYGQHLSRVQPKWIAIGFMTCDVVSLVLQAIGAGAAASNRNSSNNQGGSSNSSQGGIDIMIAGLVFQVISLAIFLLFCADFAWRCHRGSLDTDPEKAKLRQRSSMKIFLCGLLLATVCILIRSIYRAIELSDGFKGSLWNNQVDFMVLDGAMIGLATLCLTAFHPGFAFGCHWVAMNWSFRSKKALVEEIAVARKETQQESHF